MTAGTRYKLWVALAILLGGAVILPVACTSFAGFLGLLKYPLLVSPMFAVIGFEIATLFSFKKLRLKAQQEKAQLAIKPEEHRDLPPAPDFDDPDLIEAVKELNDYLPSSAPLDLQAWRKEYEPLKSETKSTTWNDLISTWNDTGSRGAGGSNSAETRPKDTSNIKTIELQYKGHTITHALPSYSSFDSIDEAFKKYAASKGVELVVWEAVPNYSANSTSINFKFRQTNPPYKYVLEKINVYHPLNLSGRYENLPAWFIAAYRRLVDKISEQNKTPSTVYVPAGIDISPQGNGVTKIAIDTDVAISYGNFVSSINLKSIDRPIIPGIDTPYHE